MEDWNEIIKKCNKENILKAPFGRCIHKIDDKFIVKNSNGEVDEMYSFVSDKDIGLYDLHKRDENEILIIKQLVGIIPVPKIMYRQNNITIRSMLME